MVSAFGVDSILPPVCILAITVPIGTTALTSNKISVMVPAVVEGISLSTLSVAISSNVSSN